MVGSFAFHRMAGVPDDRRLGSQKKIWSLRWRLDQGLLHVSGLSDPLCVRQEPICLYTSLLGLV